MMTIQTPKDQGSFNLNIGSINAEQSNIGQTVHATQNFFGKELEKYAGEILHIIGHDGFGASDQVALKNAGAKSVIVKADVAPYFDVLKQELERQREDSRVIKLWHFSGHGSTEKGLQFGKNWINFKEFNQLISVYDDLDIIFLSACSSVLVADEISGPVKYVLACAVDIPDSDAIKATEIFWKYITRNRSPEEAFEATKMNIPKFAPNLRLRGLT